MNEPMRLTGAAPSASRFDVGGRPPPAYVIARFGGDDGRAAYAVRTSRTDAERLAASWTTPNADAVVLRVDLATMTVMELDPGGGS